MGQFFCYVYTHAHEFLCICMHVTCVWVACVGVLGLPENGVKSLGAEVLESCELPEVGTGNRTQVRRAANILNHWSICPAQHRKGFMIASPGHGQLSTEVQFEFYLSRSFKNN